MVTVFAGTRKGDQRAVGPLVGFATAADAMRAVCRKGGARAARRAARIINLGYLDDQWTRQGLDGTGELRSAIAADIRQIAESFAGG